MSVTDITTKRAKPKRTKRRPPKTGFPYNLPHDPAECRSCALLVLDRQSIDRGDKGAMSKSYWYQLVNRHRQDGSEVHKRQAPQRKDRKPEAPFTVNEAALVEPLDESAIQSYLTAIRHGQREVRSARLNLLREISELMTEDLSNPEYDRACVEIACVIARLPIESTRTDMEAFLRIQRHLDGFMREVTP